MKYTIEFKRTTMTLFQQRWRSKQVIRAYHGDFINEKAFKRWYLPSLIPNVRPKRPLALSDDIGKFAGNAKTLDAQDKARRDDEDAALAKERAEYTTPVGSLMLIEVERRIDVLIFRSCMAQSVYDARRYVVHGYVTLNGKKVRQSQILLTPS